jgi:hypothetical protein
MHGSSLIFTQAEITAFNILFDAAKAVAVGAKEGYRLVDPVAKVRHLFPTRREAEGLVAKLAAKQLIKLAFCRPSDDGLTAETYDVALELWPEVAADAQTVPDPPSMTEEVYLARFMEGYEARLSVLREKKDNLAAALAAVTGEIAAAEAALKDAADLLAQVRDLRDKIGRFAEKNESFK